MRASTLALALSAGVVLAAAAAPVRYELPEETAELAPGPHREVALANCMACHSADYISTQPRGLKDPAAFWTAEVNKMRQTYGAPIPEADIKPILDYLVAAYGR